MTGFLTGAVRRDTLGRRIGRRGRFVIATVVRGTPATHFLRNTLLELAARHNLQPDVSFVRRSR